jgi:RNA polymerase sigma-70 factor (ECF subfamily)
MTTQKVSTPIMEQTQIKVKSINQIDYSERKKGDFEQAFQEKVGKRFNDFYKSYYPKLVWTIRKINIDTLDAEDIANRAFMKALTEIEKYNPMYNFSTWLFHIAKMMAYQYKKDQAKTICVESISEDIDSDLDNNVQMGLQYYINSITKIDSVNYKEEYDRALEKKYNMTLVAISKMKEKYKTVIELCDIQGKSYNDIVEITGLPMQTVKNRLHHGRLKLESELSAKFKRINEIQD